ncbi:Polyamine oxidase 3, partial [Stylophora pistillata]
YARNSGFDSCKEIFSVINSTESALCKSLYVAGFRWIEADLTSSVVGSQCWTYLIVYRPNLVPNYPVENGVKWSFIATSALINFCEDIVIILNSSDDGKQTVGQIRTLMNNFEKRSRLDLNIVHPSFPWNGGAGPSPPNQVVVVGGGLAGLTAAASLSKAGFHVVLLEASNYLGGRVKQAQPFEGFAPIDLGGEFIHGSNTVVNKIARDNDWVVLPASQCKAGEEGEKLYYKGKLYSPNSNQREIKLAREAWAELINSKYRNQEQETEPDSVKVRLEEKGLSRDVLDVIDWWKMKISAGSLEHYGVREGRRRMESKYEWGIEDCR